MEFDHDARSSASASKMTRSSASFQLGSASKPSASSWLGSTDAGSILWSTINRNYSPEGIQKESGCASGRDPLPLPLSLEDAAVAAVMRLQEDLPALTMIPEPTAAVDSSLGGYSR